MYSEVEIMLINEACKKCKLTKKAIEYYCEQGLIKPIMKQCDCASL